MAGPASQNQCGMQLLLAFGFCCHVIFVPPPMVDLHDAKKLVESNVGAAELQASDGLVGATEEAKVPSDDATKVECGVWLAMSSLPGTGIGMFAGKSFAQGDELMSNIGDHCIPIIDISLYHEEITFLWDEYTWNAQFLRADNLGMSEVNVASAGFGAAANSFMDFLNVDEGVPEHSIAQNLRRTKDPGAGAFSPYHTRKSTARRNIKAGQELFVSYGNKWFINRENLGPIPVQGSHAKAERLLTSYLRLKTKFSPVELLENAWDTFVLNSTWSSRVIAALPESKDEYEEVAEHGGLINMKRNRMVRTQDWLEKNGVCADNFYAQPSTIPQAGNGAFAVRFLKKGTPILPVPVIHIPDRKVMEMYETFHNPGRGSSGTRAANRTKIVGHQLLLNYALGHRDSTILLSPYGPAFNLINHNQTQANVRLQWASPERSNHHPELLEKNLMELGEVQSSQLAFELIALRDIQPNEEIFLDYGDEWEEAWQEHVKSWKPVEGADDYISALDMEERTEPLKTEFEQMKNPYPSNLSLRFDRAFEHKGRWQLLLESGGDLNRFKEKQEKFLDKCEIMRYRELEGRTLYTVVIPEEHEGTTYTLIEDVPREAFVFVDRPHTSDISLKNAFRHDIRIPDDLFPEAWKTTNDN